jgi:tetratricopeptide (TPR) repeat protein
MELKSLDHAYELVAEGNVHEAIKLFEDFAVENPESIFPKMEIAGFYYVMGELTKCISIYQDILKNNPNNLYVRYRLGVAYYRETNFSNARDTFQKLLIPAISFQCLICGWD